MTQLIKNEIDIMLKLTSPYIVKLIDIKRTAKNIYLIEEYCDGGSLEKLLEQSKNSN